MAGEPKMIDALVDSLLGPRAQEMSARERNAAVRAFVEAGKAAVQLRTGKARDAAEAVRRSRRLLGEARQAVARTSGDRSPHVLVDRAWAPVHRALREHREALQAIPGVIGTGMGFKRRGGSYEDERTVIAYVRRKRDPDELARAGGKAVPKTLRAGKATVPTDVVELGDFQPQIDAGCSFGPQTGGRQGTLGVFAEDQATGQPVGLTANHVTGHAGAFPPGGAITLCAPAGGAVLGQLVRGCDTPVDAAAVRVDPPAAGSRRISGIGEIHGRRVVTSAEIGASFFMFGATSGLLAGVLRDPEARISGLAVQPAITVQMSTQLGDSGGALVDGSGLVLGILSGRFTGPDGLAVFSPIIAVLSQLGCRIRTS